jgi:FixJ family two-component response regulator
VAMKERTESQMVLVVDDDPSVRKALTYLFQSMELPVKAFTMASELLDGKLPDVPKCLVLDIRLPGGSGLEFQEALAKAGSQLPIVFLTGHGDIPMSVKAMKAGAIDFLTKPFRDQDILDAVTRALNQDRKRRAGEKALSDLRQRFETLTQREREVMALAASGLRNKQIAYQLQVEEITVKIHRGRAMKKMEARSLADLVSMAETLGIRRTD